jgi:hypothetical protein
MSNDVIFLGSAKSETVDKHSFIAKLTDHDFNVVESANGWLENTVIQHAHVLLKKVSPNIQGFQRPSLEPYLNFDQVNGDFVQILHTGGNHWVCTSSIGCLTGVVNLFDSLFNDIILGNLEQQVRNLVGQNFEEISVVSVQQQENGSDCGVFAIAFATALVYSLEPSATAFDVPKMRSHLSTCLKSGVITSFPTI